MSAGQEPVSSRVEELLEHAVWLRRLAAALVRDDAAADDLVQDTWVAAMESGPPPGAPKRAWLGGVARNLARMRFRGASRRERRERDAAPREQPLPGADELAARLEAQRRLADAVAALAEPGRSVVILRWFEGLSSAEIARRRGEPEGTVRWRLKQAMDELRARLDAAHDGDRRAWIVAFTPLAEMGATPATDPPPVSTAPATAAVGGGLALASAKSFAAATLLAVLLGGVAWVALRDELPSAASQSVSQAASSGATDRGDAQRDRARAQATGSQSPTPAPVTWTTGAPANARASGSAIVRGRVVDKAGSPVAGAFVRVRRAAASAPLLVSADGRFELTVPVGSWGVPTVEAGAPSHALLRAYPRVRADEAADLGDLVLLRGGSVAGVVIDDDGRGVAGAWVGAVGHAYVQVTTTPMEALAPTEPASVPGRWTDAYGEEAQLCPGTTTRPDGTFLLEGVETGSVTLIAGGTGLSTTRGVVDVMADAQTRDVRIALRRRDVSKMIRIAVRDEAGRPVSGALVIVRYKNARLVGTTSVWTDRAGRALLATHGPRAQTGCTLQVTGSEAGHISEPVSDVFLGADEVVLVARVPGAQSPTARLLAIEAVDPAGEPVAGFGVRVLAADGKRVLATSLEGPQPGGVAKIEVPAESFDVTVFARGRSEGAVRGLDPAAVPARLRIPLAPAPLLRGRVRGPEGAIAGASVYLLRALGEDEAFTSGGFPMTRNPQIVAAAHTASDGSYALQVAREGRYFIRAEAESGELAELGPLDLAAAADATAPDIETGPGGVLTGRVTGRDGRPAAGVSVLAARGDGAVQSATTARDGSYRMERLLPGRWMMRVAEDAVPSASETVRTPGPATFPWACTIGHGGTTRHDVDLASIPRCLVRGTLEVPGAPGAQWFVGIPSRTPAEVGADGAFEMVHDAAGERALVFTTRGAELLVHAPVTFASGVVRRDVRLAVGRLEGRVIAATDADRLRLTGLVYVTERDDGVFAHASVRPDAEGRFAVPTVLAGRGRIVRRDPAPNVADPRRWPIVAEFDVAEGKTTDVEVR